MRTRIFTTIAAAAALTATPVMAQSVEAQRAPAAIDQSEQLSNDDDGSGVVIAVLAALLIIAALVIALSGDDDEDLPASP